MSLWIPIVPLVVIFTLGWWRQNRSLNAGWVDVLWAFSTGLLGLSYAVFGGGDTQIRLVVGLIYLLWFGRLGWHLMSRVAGHPEEGRYAHMRDWAGPRAPWVFAIFYLIQASWVWLFALPAWVLSQGQLPPIPFLVLGLAIVAIAWAGENLADRQLARFKAREDTQGKTCREGLWRYSRHPNYFFEWLHWFAYPLLAWSTPGGQWLWLAPVLVFIFLYYVTGIPYTEKQALRSRGEDYRQYQKETSMFIPWRPNT